MKIAFNTFILTLFILLTPLIFYFIFTFNYPYQFTLSGNSKVNLYLNDALVKVIDVQGQIVITIDEINPITSKPYAKNELIKIALQPQDQPIVFKNINIPFRKAICSKDLAGLQEIECQSSLQPSYFYTFKI